MSINWDPLSGLRRYDPYRTHHTPGGALCPREIGRTSALYAEALRLTEECEVTPPPRVYPANHIIMNELLQEAGCPLRVSQISNAREDLRWFYDWLTARREQRRWEEKFRLDMAKARHELEQDIRQYRAAPSAE